MGSALVTWLGDRILQESIAYAHQRKQFGQRIGDFQLVQAMLADSQAEILAGWSLVQEVARWAAAGFKDTLLRWMMKPEVVYGNETAVQPGVQA